MEGVKTEGENEYYQEDDILNDNAEDNYDNFAADEDMGDHLNGDANGSNGAVKTEENENNSGEDATAKAAAAKAKSKDDDKRKLFVGGLSWDTKEKDLKDYFSKFGEVEGLTYKTDAMTGRPRGFAFIIFQELSAVEQVLAQTEHLINGKKVDPKRAKARPGKIFVGGLTAEITNDEVKDYFLQFGSVVDMEVPIDKTTNQRKNYCFVTFDDISVAQEVLKNPKQTICGKDVDVKQAVPMASNKPGWNEPGMGRGGRGGRGGGSMRGRGGWAGYGATPAYGGPGGYSSWGGAGYGGGYGYEPYAAGYYDGGYDGYGASGYEAYGPPVRGRGRGGSFAGKMRGARGGGGVARHTPY